MIIREPHDAVLSCYVKTRSAGNCKTLSFCTIRNDTLPAVVQFSDATRLVNGERLVVAVVVA